MTAASRARSALSSARAISRGSENYVCAIRVRARRLTVMLCGRARMLQPQCALNVGAETTSGGEMFKDVLIGVDGRQGGRDAVALARELATPEARFTLAHVY